MKPGLRKLFFSGNRRWLPLLLFIMGFGIQIAGKWLPTLVICYKPMEKPKIEFFDDGCDCRKACANHTLAGFHEGGARWQSNCLDVPLIADPLCGPLPRLLFLQGGLSGPAYESFTAPLSPVPFFRNLGIGRPPSWSERADNGSRLILHPGGVDSILCRFIC
jgi:hypothetical protein